MTAKTKEIEQEQYFQRLSLLFEKASPIINYIANPASLSHGFIPVSPRRLVESNITLQLILRALKKLPKSENKELSNIEREFEVALTHCIKAAELSEKFIEITDHHQDGALFSSIINSTVLAHEYIESAQKKLTQYETIYKRNLDQKNKLEQLKEINEAPVTTDNKSNKFHIKTELKHRPAYYIETALDKLGDMIIVLFGSIVNLFRSLFSHTRAKH